MTVDMGRYTELLDKFRGISQPYADATVLERLKEKYKNVIDSPRQLEKIDNIASLLKVLEKRGVLQYDDINVLSDIAKDFVNDKAIEDLINDYNIWFNENSSRINNLYNCVITSKANPPDKMPFYSSNFSMGFAVNQSQSFASTSRPNVDKERELQDLVISKLSKEVGRKWADVSRRLKIRESEIDAIQASNENYNYENMFKQALRLYFSEPHPTWKMDLKKALEASRRRDLQEMLEKLFHERYS